MKHSPDKRAEMKYMMIISTDKNSQAGRDFESGAPPNPKLMAAIADHAKKLANAGVLLDTGGLLPRSRGAKIRAEGGSLTVTDGPYIESRDLIGGYAILRAGSKEEAVELGKAFMSLHTTILGTSYQGEMEVRQMFDPSDDAPKQN